LKVEVKLGGFLSHGDTILINPPSPWIFPWKPSSSQAAKLGPLATTRRQVIFVPGNSWDCEQCSRASEFVGCFGLKTNVTMIESDWSCGQTYKTG